MNSRPLKVLLAFLATIVLASTVLAESSEIVVNDTSGVTRAVFDASKQGQLEFQLLDAAGNPADGIEVTLTNAATSETLTATSVGGTVTFDAIAPGTWTVASGIDGVTFTNIAFNAAGAAALTGSVVPAVVGIGGLAAAGTAAVAITNSSDSTDSDPLSPAS
ncbi:MAG: hypothetical protein K1X83_13545 [Oligoflexia bacterium]|nr:hypothetical protein [Oligoflexia bacterium]